MQEKKCYELRTSGITMQFPGVRALDNVNFTMKSGEVRAVVGANGAGKSTLMKVLSGANPGYEGEIWVDGERKEIRSPATAKQLGIEIVYQEVDTALFPELSAAENIMFNVIAESGYRNSFLKWKEIQKKAAEILKKLHVELDVTVPAGNLTLAQKQMVLIARAISASCHFLILDEPTAPLSINETKTLFQVIGNLMASETIGVIFISHRLPELFEICQSMTVMRDGKIVNELQITPELKVNDVVRMMLGRSLEESERKTGNIKGEVILDVEKLTDRNDTIKEVSLYARSGEIVGVSGLVGAGKTELSKVLFGATPQKKGEIRIHGKHVTIKSPTQAVTCGIALVPEERRKEGIIVSDTVNHNLSAANLSKFTNLSFVNRRKEKDNATQYVKELGIKTPSIEQKVGFLSGGNQQKVAIGKWLSTDCEVYIMDEPTKGVDVGAKLDIYKLIHEIAEQGKCVLYLTSEINEILSVTDRTYVMYNGMIAAELSTADTSEEEILYYSTGGTKYGGTI